jgi:hypothetical protein
MWRQAQRWGGMREMDAEQDDLLKQPSERVATTWPVLSLGSARNHEFILLHLLDWDFTV